MTIFVNFAKVSTSSWFSAQHFRKRQFYFDFFLQGAGRQLPLHQLATPIFFANKKIEAKKKERKETAEI